MRQFGKFLKGSIKDSDMGERPLRARTIAGANYNLLRASEPVRNQELTIYLFFKGK